MRAPEDDVLLRPDRTLVGISTPSRREPALTDSAEGHAVLERYDDRRLVELRSLLDGPPADRRPHAPALLTDVAGASSGGPVP
jgi:hypothetical protein